MWLLCLALTWLPEAAPQLRGVKKPLKVNDVVEMGEVVVHLTTSPASTRPGLSKTTPPFCSSAKVTTKTWLLPTTCRT